MELKRSHAGWILLTLLMLAIFYMGLWVIGFVFVLGMPTDGSAKSLYNTAIISYRGVVVFGAISLVCNWRWPSFLALNAAMIFLLALGHLIGWFPADLRDHPFVSLLLAAVLLAIFNLLLSAALKQRLLAAGLSPAEAGVSAQPIGQMVKKAGTAMRGRRH